MNKPPIIKRIFLPLIVTVVITGNIFSQGSAKTSGPLLMETVLLSTDRTIYLPGEEILLYATIAEADNYLPSSLSRILRIELLSSDGNPVIQEKMEATEGRVAGALRIPGSISSGWYQIRAYTNWMRNSGPGYYSTLNIKIINPSGLDNVYISGMADTLYISLFPAGSNNLVAGIESEYAVRVTDQHGNPHSIKGYMVTGPNDTITSFSTGNAGWGKILFTPETDREYQFVAEAGDKRIITRQLPAVQLSGNILSHKKSDGAFAVSFRQTGSANGGKVRLLVHSLYHWYWYGEAVQSGDKALFMVPLNILPPAVVQFTILDEKNNILGHRLLTGSDIVGTGTRIKAQSVADDKGSAWTTGFQSDYNGSAGNYSVLIRKREPSELLSVYIPGLPGWGVNYEIPLNESERDAWLMAQSYDKDVVYSLLDSTTFEPLPREINFKDLNAWREEMVSFLPETRGLTINGSLTDRKTGKPVREEVLSLSTFSDNFLYLAKSYDSGRFHFSMPFRRGQEDMILSYARAPGDEWELKLFPDFETEAAKLPPAKVTLTPSELEYIRELSIDMQLDLIYNSAPGAAEVIRDTLAAGKNRFFGYPDDVVFVDDFIRLPNMREVIFEVVPSVVVRREDDKWIIRVINTQSSPKVYHPLIMLDGIPMIEFDQFLDLPPERIRKVEVIRNLYIHGNIIFAGIVNFVSVNGDLAGLDLPAGSQIISMDMPSSSRNIDVEIIDTEEENIPQLSNLLKLQPFIISGRGSLNFRLSDNRGEYIILFNGFTGSGRWVTATDSFSAGRDNPGN